MAFCPKCGHQISDSSVYCENCGERISSAAYTYHNDRNNSSGNTSRNYSISEGSENILWMLVSIFVPILGLILYFVWRDTNYVRAKSCLRGFLISVTFVLVSTLISSCYFFGMANAIFSIF